MAVVDIVIPTQRGIEHETNSNLSLMIRDTQCFCGTHEAWKCPKGRHSVRLLPVTSGTVVHWARNQAITMALYGQVDDGRPPAEFLFLMDDDMLCQPWHLNRLLSYRKDIVTGIATVRRDPPRPNIRMWDAEKEHFITPVEWDWDTNKLIEIDAVGAAYLLVKRSVLEEMAAAYLNCHFERLVDKRKFPNCQEIDAYWNKKAERRRARFEAATSEGGDWKEADGQWFQFLDNIADSQATELGEDISFCWKAKMLGFRIFADPQVLPGHIGKYAYSIIDYRDWVESGKDCGALPETMPANAVQLNPEAHVDSSANR
jgi:hypothetical protein